MAVKRPRISPRPTPESLKQEPSPRLLLAPAMLEAFGATDAGLEHAVTLPADTGPAHGTIRTEEPWRTMNNNRWPRRDLSPVPFPGDEGPWRHLLADVDELPLYPQRPDDWYWDVSLGDGASFLRVNAVRDQVDHPSLKDYLQHYLDRLSLAGTDVVVLDLRANAGGNADLTTQFAERLPNVVGDDGKIFVLIGGNTFSAAIVLAVRLKHFGESKVVLVGAPLGDRPRALWNRMCPYRHRYRLSHWRRHRLSCHRKSLSQALRLHAKSSAWLELQKSLAVCLVRCPALI